MAIEVVIPRLGWSMDEGTFAEWLKKDGEWVNKGDMLFVLEGEKAAQEIESFDEGVLHIPPAGAKTGDTVLVGQVIGYLLARGEAIPTSSKESSSVSSPSAVGRPAAGPAARRLARNLGVDLGQVAGSGRGGRITTADVQCAQGGSVQEAVLAEVALKRRRITPRARRIARQLNIDVASVTGTGRDGRIRERDVQATASKLSAHDHQSSRTQSIRKTIAARMTASFQGTAPVTLTTRVDTSNLEVLRKGYKVEMGADAPSLTVLLVKLAATALGQHPYMNARWEQDRSVESSEINIGLAVDTEAGLLVPVLRNVGEAELRELSKRSRDLAERARQGRLAMQEMQDGTFTVTNLGVFGIDAFTPIINTPEIAILGIGALRREAVVLPGDHIALRDMLTLSLTFDHRAVDGAPAARFLQTLCRMIEECQDWLRFG